MSESADIGIQKQTALHLKMGKVTVTGLLTRRPEPESPKNSRLFGGVAFLAGSTGFGTLAYGTYRQPRLCTLL